MLSAINNAATRATDTIDSAPATASDFASKKLKTLDEGFGMLVAGCKPVANVLSRVHDTGVFSGVPVVSIVLSIAALISER